MRKLSANYYCAVISANDHDLIDHNGLVVRAGPDEERATGIERVDAVGDGRKGADGNVGGNECATGDAKWKSTITRSVHVDILWLGNLHGGASSIEIISVANAPTQIDRRLNQRVIQVCPVGSR